MDNIQKDLESSVRNIAERLTKVYGGLVYHCPEHGEFTEEEAPEGVCPECDELMEVVDFGMELEDNLGVDVIASLDGTFRHCRITLTWGGPNIYVDTDMGVVKGYWGSAYAEQRLENKVCDAIEDYIVQYWGL